MALGGKTEAGYVTEGEANLNISRESPHSESEDDFSEKQTYTSTRSITLDTRYAGAITIDIWTGKAVLVVSKSGERKVIRGPQTYLLEYDETLEPMILSTGTPKSSKKEISTVYIRVLNNKVSDIISAESKDLCQIKIYLSYRVNFEGDPNRWFNVENYVKFLTDNMRSIIRNTVKQKGIEEFYGNSTNIIRDAILGIHSENGERRGRFFEENGMKVYDVEVLDVSIDDGAISGLLKEAQHNTVQQAIQIAQEERKLEITQRFEDIKRKVACAQTETKLQTLALSIEE